ncbi:hypothetical protein IE077_000865 [Cardiosporidium cionae]|uniref:Uncharacterized protein n=1 Tax=Cardiosporidium cionae TaxID=476202 RepID=A0ABQ7J6F0_9APIC|nr:hypothetical protein IE077_000865 [Cardiosporidium cionae]|eukprot:KAF8819546.1 hypothetical protein IE077_000865 [Cardiosporidium cionae]
MIGCCYLFITSICLINAKQNVRVNSCHGQALPSAIDNPQPRPCCPLPWYFCKNQCPSHVNLPPCYSPTTFWDSYSLSASFMEASRYTSPPGINRALNAPRVHKLLNAGGVSLSAVCTPLSPFSSSNTIRTSRSCLWGLRIHTVPRDVLPPRVALDYETILREADVEEINYGTQLRSTLGKERVMAMDSLDGRIWDRSVLLKQLAYFIQKDDFSMIKRILKENRFILYKEDTPILTRNVLSLLYIRFFCNQTLPTILPRHLLQRKPIEYTLFQTDPREMHHIYENSTNVSLSQAALKAHTDFLDSIVQYTKAMMGIATPLPLKIFANITSSHTEKSRLSAQEAILSRFTLVLKGLWFHGAIGSQNKRNRWKHRRTVDISLLSPHLLPPAVVDHARKQEVNRGFREAVEREDLVTACFYLRRETRLLELAEDPPLVKRFLSLYQVVHSCGKYDEKRLKELRNVWWSTVYQHRVLIKLLEIKSSLTDEEIDAQYEIQLQAYRDRQKQRNVNHWMKRGVNLTDFSYDFSNAKGYDWIPDILGTTPMPIVSEKKKKKKKSTESESDETGTLPDTVT